MTPGLGNPELLKDGPAVRAELIFLAVALAMVLILGLAGVPGTREHAVDDGSPALRQGWLAQHQAQSRARRGQGGRGLDAATEAQLALPTQR